MEVFREILFLIVIACSIFNLILFRIGVKKIQKENEQLEIDNYHLNAIIEELEKENEINKKLQCCKNCKNTECSKVKGL